MNDAQNKIQKSAQNSDSIIHNITAQKSSSEVPMKKMLMIFGLVIVVGVLSGFGVSYVSNASGSSGAKVNSSGTETLSDDDNVVESAGIADKETFSDSAEGVIEAGGHESGEGSFRLIRPGGEDQTAYLTSSTVDLSEFEGKEVRVYGETFAAQHVAWLMDVGFVEVLQK